MTTSRTPWDEDGISEADIVVRQQNEIAVYENNGGGVSIRERCWPEDDVIITVAPENAHQLCDAILRVAAEITGEDAELAGEDDDSDDSPEPQRPRKDRTAAERMRRHRAKRNDERNTVTPKRNGTMIISDGVPLLPFSPSPANDDEKEGGAHVTA